MKRTLTDFYCRFVMIFKNTNATELDGGRIDDVDSDLVDVDTSSRIVFDGSGPRS